MTISPGKQLVAEAIGTFIRVFFGAGAAAVTLMRAPGTTPSTPFDIGIGVLGGIVAQLLSAAAASLLFAWAVGPDAVTVGASGQRHPSPASATCRRSSSRPSGRSS